ncbi:MAG: PadR family transcriptional regulator [Dehalococcoidia bacterium]|nr:PadR family transcriptional regulator [Dehalococcoidia bacterium]
MATANDRLNPAQYAILGLLDAGPAHGYDLVRSFNEGGDLAGVVRLEQASLYAALKDLAGRGLIEGHEERDGLRPQRIVYEPTNAGRKLLQEWIETPVSRLREIRLDFLLKIYFARLTGRASVADLLATQIAVCHRYLADLESASAALPPDGFAYLVTQSKVSAARATLDWLQDYRRNA